MTFSCNTFVFTDLCISTAYDVLTLFVSFTSTITSLREQSFVLVSSAFPSDVTVVDTQKIRHISRRRVSGLTVLMARVRTSPAFASVLEACKSKLLK